MSTQAWQLRSAASCPRHAVRGVRSICWRNLGARVPHRLRKRVAREVSVIFETSGLAEAKKLLGEFGARWKKELPEAVEVLERGFGAATQFYAFPEAHWPRLRTTNSLERLHGEIKRQDQGRRRLPGPGQRPQAHHGRRTQDHTRLGRPALPRPLTPPETGGRPSSLVEGDGASSAFTHKSGLDRSEQWRT